MIIKKNNVPQNWFKFMVIILVTMLLTQINLPFLNDIRLIPDYFIALIISAIIGIIFYKIKTDSKKPSVYEKILTVLLGYILMPLILSIPFYLSIYNLSFLNSLFEAVSGFTSTGFTVFENIKHILSLIHISEPTRPY